MAQGHQRLCGKMSKAERPPITYIYDREKRCFFFISNLGTKHKVTQAAIIANGIQDLCIGKDMDIHKISEMKPEDIHYVPKGDILCLKIEPPFNGKLR